MNIKTTKDLMKVQYECVTEEQCNNGMLQISASDMSNIISELMRELRKALMLAKVSGYIENENPDYEFLLHEIHVQSVAASLYTSREEVLNLIRNSN